MSIPALTLNSKTYTFSSYQAGVFTWNETSGGIPTGFSKLTGALRAPDRPGGAYRVDWRLSIPAVATEDSACACTGSILRTEIARILVEIPDNGTTAERTDMQVTLKDLMANTSVMIPMLKDLVLPA